MHKKLTLILLVLLPGVFSNAAFSQVVKHPNQRTLFPGPGQIDVELNDFKYGVAVQNLEASSAGGGFFMNDTGNYLDIGILGSSNNIYGSGGESFLGYSSDLIFLSDNIVERMRLTSSGDLGIGTSTPAAPLDVVGNAQIAGNLSLFNTFNNCNNIYIGLNAGTTTTANCQRTFIGLNAGQTSTGGENVFVGDNTGLAATGGGNTYVGSRSGSATTSGVQNTALGLRAGEAATTEGFSVYVGAFTGSSSAGDEVTYVGYNVNSSGDTDNSFALGSNITVTSKNTGVLGNAGMLKVGSSVNWSSVSDKRFKKGVKENVKGLDFIMNLRPVTYQLEAEKLYQFSKAEAVEDNARERGEASEGVQAMDFSPALQRALAQKSEVTYNGFLAQEVEEAAERAGFDFSGVVKPSHEKEPYGLRYAEFTVPLVKAVQEQQDIIDKQEEENLVLKEKLDQLENKVEELSALVEKLLAHKSEEQTKTLKGEIRDDF